MNRVRTTIEVISEAIGRLDAFLILPLLVVVAFEVLMRYGLNAPTVWAFEATTLLYGVHFALAFAYTHKHGGHVAIDVLAARLSKRWRSLLRIATNVVLFLPTVGLLAIWSSLYAATSWVHWERASTSWAPPLYPFKTIMALGFILLFFQGVANLMADLDALGRGADEPAARR